MNDTHPTFTIPPASLSPFASNVYNTVVTRRTFLTTLAAFGMDAVATGRLIAQMPSKQGLVDLHHHILPAFLPGMRDYVMAAWRVAGRQQDLPARMSEWSPQTSL